KRKREIFTPTDAPRGLIRPVRSVARRPASRKFSESQPGVAARPGIEGPPAPALSTVADRSGGQAVDVPGKTLVWARTTVNTRTRCTASPARAATAGVGGGPRGPSVGCSNQLRPVAPSLRPSAPTHGGRPAGRPITRRRPAPVRRTWARPVTIAKGRRMDTSAPVAARAGGPPVGGV